MESIKGSSISPRTAPLSVIVTSIELMRDYLLILLSDVAFTCNLGDDKMYPILALDHRTTVSTNFGQEEYKYKISNIDYEGMVFLILCT